MMALRIHLYHLIRLTMKIAFDQEEQFGYLEVLDGAGMLIEEAHVSSKR